MKYGAVRDVKKAEALVRLHDIKNHLSTPLQNHINAVVKLQRAVSYRHESPRSNIMTESTRLLGLNSARLWRP
jgi:hypothetical protein